jgi:hypothetical protein
VRRLAKHWDPMNAQQKPEKGTVGRQTANGKQGRLSRASTCTTNVAARLMFRLHLRDEEIERNSDVECSEKRSGSISRFVNIPASVHQTIEESRMIPIGQCGTGQRMPPPAQQKEEVPSLSLQCPWGPVVESHCEPERTSVGWLVQRSRTRLEV